jgi:hypothetical protein
VPLLAVPGNHDIRTRSRGASRARTRSGSASSGRPSRVLVGAAPRRRGVLGRPWRQQAVRCPRPPRASHGRSRRRAPGALRVVALHHHLGLLRGAPGASGR